ncbi:MAG: hypothetical protein EOO07_08630 [Chitinophagaceae bacterium]|nr:MAG: hypothetical protein EOO07_08630 [Chitinophagaceae bacterium]
MKTDLVEIFQTIRAEMQPYTTMGLNARTNSDTCYDLWKEKGFVNDSEVEERHFAGLEIKDDYVDFKFTEEASMKIKELDEVLLQQISDALASGFQLYKQNEWV